jgi:predicted O-linked N-acetylglucosamine transferase (SPINDLY family)
LFSQIFLPVAASLLHALGLPELITRSLPDYEAKALSLTHDSAALADLKAKLARQRKVAPLFDTARFTRNLESAFATMRDRNARGEAPRSFAVGESAP